MCKHGTLKKIQVIRRNNPYLEDGWHDVFVDSCIADEIQELNNKGIITINSCCGHGNKTQKNILFDSKFKKEMENEGYNVVEYTSKHTERGILIAYC